MEELTPPKMWYNSKTFWANLGVITGAIAGYFTGEIPASAAVTTITTAIANLLLRIITKEPVSLVKVEPTPVVK